jgi:hypothetical protein
LTPQYSFGIGNGPFGLGSRAKNDLLVDTVLMTEFASNTVFPAGNPHEIVQPRLEYYQVILVLDNNQIAVSSFARVSGFVQKRWRAFMLEGNR